MARNVLEITMRLKSLVRRRRKAELSVFVFSQVDKPWRWQARVAFWLLKLLGFREEGA